MLWGVKDSFLAYLARMEGSRISVGKGAGYEESEEFSYPLASAADFDEESNTGALSFAGQVRFTGHFGMLDLPLSAPRIDVGRRGASLTMRVGDGSEGEVVRVADLAWPAPSLAPEGWRVWSAIPAVLTEAAVELFNGAYRAGEPLAPLRVGLQGASSTARPCAPHAPAGNSHVTH